MEATELTAEQKAESQRIADIVAAGAWVEALQIERLLASRQDAELFGETESGVQDATGVLPQRRHAKRPEGRMTWVASVFHPVPRDVPATRRWRLARSVSGHMSLDETSNQSRHESWQVGVDQADTEPSSLANRKALDLTGRADTVRETHRQPCGDL